MEKFLMEAVQIKAVMEPVDLNTAAVTGARVAMANAQRIAIVIAMGDSTAAVATFTLRQHTAASAGTSKDLSVMNPYYKKVGAATSFTKVAPTVAAAAYDLSTDFAAEPGIVVLEVLSEDLDNENGYTHVSVDIADSTAAKIASGLYVLTGNRYSPPYDLVV